MAKRRFDDKATLRTDTFGFDAATQYARAERIYDPNDAVTDDPTVGGIAGVTDTKKITTMTGVLRTGLNDDPSLAVNKAYK